MFIENNFINYQSQITKFLIELSQIAHFTFIPLQGVWQTIQLKESVSQVGILYCD